MFHPTKKGAQVFQASGYSGGYCRKARPRGRRIGLALRQECSQATPAANALGGETI
jgi:hypothetical protein